MDREDTTGRDREAGRPQARGLPLPPEVETRLGEAARAGLLHPAGTETQEDNLDATHVRRHRFTRVQVAPRYEAGPR